MESRFWIRPIVAAFASIAMVAAQADIRGGALTVTASDEAGHTATFVWSVDNLSFHAQDNSWRGTMNTPFEFRTDEGALLATINELDLVLHEDPSVFMAFSVAAGVSDTTFLISTALLSFPVIPAAIGRASAGFSLTDTDGNGATMTGLLAGGTGYEAQYNGIVGSVFTDLVKGYSVGPGGSATSFDNDPFLGYRPVGAAVADIHSLVNFKVTKHDLASGTNVFEVVPEPSTYLAAGAGLLGLLRRRKR